MTAISRRVFLATSAAMLAPIPTWAANNGSVTRSFQATRGSSNVGQQQITLTRSGDQVIIDLRTKLNVKLLGLSVYRYNLNSREIWEGGQIVAMSGKTNDNGKTKVVEARRVSGGLDVKGSGFTGLVKGELSTTSFFTTDIINRKTWISTVDGKPKKVAIAKRGAAQLSLPSGQVTCTHYYIGGDLSIPVDAYFDEHGDLVGYMFDAAGKRGRMIAQSNSPKLRSVWT